MNSISLEKVKVNYADAEVQMLDLFIDGFSLQETLKNNYPDLFSKGRFNENFMLYLGRTLLDIYHSNEEHLQSPIPKQGKTNITALYGCSDACCVYLYTKVSRTKNRVYWNEIGRNSAFISSSQNDLKKIEWLPNFKMLTFDLKNYQSILKK